MAIKKMNKIFSDEQKHQAAEDEDTKTGEESISGSTPDLESDDNTLDAAHEAGLYEDQDEEHPGEIGIAQEEEKDEKQHQEED